MASSGLTCNHLDSLGHASTGTRLDPLGSSEPARTYWFTYVTTEQEEAVVQKWKISSVIFWDALRAHMDTTRNDFPVTGNCLKARSLPNPDYWPKLVFTILSTLGQKC